MNSYRYVLLQCDSEILNYFSVIILFYQLFSPYMIYVSVFNKFVCKYILYVGYKTMTWICLKLCEWYHITWIRNARTVEIYTEIFDPYFLIIQRIKEYEICSGIRTFAKTAEKKLNNHLKHFLNITRFLCFGVLQPPVHSFLPETVLNFSNKMSSKMWYKSS